jgi:hypothetical protein
MGDNKTDISKTVNMGFGLELKFLESEDFGDFTTYWNTILLNGNFIVFSDSLTEFEIKNGFPKARKIGDQIEVLLYVNDRPSIEKLRMLVVQNNKIVRDELIPYFTDPNDIDNDGIKEFVGVMSYYEMSGDSSMYMPYDPILVYEYNANGIKIDSSETVRINTIVYDKFYGYQYSEDYKFKGNERFETELTKHK